MGIPGAGKSRVADDYVARGYLRLNRDERGGSLREIAVALGADALAWATSGGEDFELLLTCDPTEVDALRDGLGRATGTALTVVGTIGALEAGLTFLDAGGLPVAMRAGYEHFSG